MHPKEKLKVVLEIQQLIFRLQMDSNLGKTELAAAYDELAKYKK